MAMLEVQNINCFYGNVQVLWDVSLHVGEAEIVALLGANGAGKTTLLNTITGFVKPTSGHVSYMGQPLDGVPSHSIMEKGIAYLPEGGRIFPDMSIKENLEMGAYPKSLWKSRKAAMDRMFELFPKLKERQKQLASTLSGGEKQMLAMARGLMSNPKLCLFDELSYGLAPIIVTEVFNIVKSLREQGITVLLVEQNVKQSLEIADRAYVLENGRVALDGPCCDLLDNDYVKKAYLGL
ncbi:MAG: ABC transporter ATP-binding protein [Clostridiales bacterium]|jgi:branched-chain amino acid transport system ATP-binding protein|nr:ABC transporter ATP-binding protein [Clostridiales bacterium]